MPAYHINAGLKQPAYLQLYRQIRDDITGGVCPYGMKLPSKRFLAAETGLSVITVQHAYDLLADEGYIRSQERSGYYVIYRESDLFAAAPLASPASGAGGAAATAVGCSAGTAGTTSGADGTAATVFGAAGTAGTISGDSAPPDMPSVREGNTFTGDTSHDYDIPIRGPVVTPEQEQFPFGVFSRTARKVLTEQGDAIFRRSPNNGIPALREELAAYLQRSRRIIVSPEQIIIGSGSEYLYNLIVQMLGRERVFALEDPSYEKIRLVYEASGVRCELLPMDREGVRVDALRRTRASVLHVTPFNSYPSGITATASRRGDYIRWASGKDRFIVEDDFDSEFSMSTKAEDTLFSLEPDRSTIYMNTFSRTVAPAVRVGYMVLPTALYGSLSEKISFYSCTVPVFTQYVLAELLRSGDFERHINRVRRRRRQMLSPGQG
ncbi:MAG: PLP-dependent aminotransferase family protein [Eubacteriales bacterium]|nr:PLP-dependent aminotransferase family protein [Eubacteriales bacterium]